MPGCKCGTLWYTVVQVGVVWCHHVACLVAGGVGGAGGAAGRNARLLFLSGLSMITAHMINIHLWRMLGLSLIGWPRWDAAVIGWAELANNRLNVAWLALWLSWYHHCWWPRRETLLQSETTTSFPHRSRTLTRLLILTVMIMSETKVSWWQTKYRSGGGGRWSCST